MPIVVLVPSLRLSAPEPELTSVVRAQTDAGRTLLLYFLSSVIGFNYIVPVSLYVSIGIRSPRLASPRRRFALALDSILSEIF